MTSKRFLISWISSSVIMFLLSYAWHGVFLTDYSKLKYPLEIFLVFSVIVYLFIGFVLAKAVDLPFLTLKFKKKPIVRGVIAGILIGVALYIIATVIGVSFNTSVNIKNVLFDVSWQMIEQLVGGVVIGLVHYLVFDPTSVFGD